MGITHCGVGASGALITDFEDQTFDGLIVETRMIGNDGNGTGGGLAWTPFGIIRFGSVAAAAHFRQEVQLADREELRVVFMDITSLPGGTGETCLLIV